MEPRAAALATESSSIPAGTDERFSGYAVIGIPFSSGHVLAMRRFPLSTVGPAYNSVWHRDPGGSWTIVASAPPRQSCARYFGDAVERELEAEVDVQWTGGTTLHVSVQEPVGLDWTISLQPTPLTRAMSAALPAVPDSLWRHRWFSQAMGAVAATTLRTGTMKLSGQTPNRQQFVARPCRIWLVEDSSGSIGGTDVGRPAPLTEQTSLGDFWLPQRGVFMVGWSAFSAHT